MRIKSDLVEICAAAGKPDALVRIACRALEAWCSRFILASLAALLRMKRAANRPTDQPAIAKIERALGEQEG